MTAEYICERTNCGKPAAGVLSFDFFPFQALMKFHKTDKPLTHIVMGLKVCGEHFKEIDSVTFLGANVWPIVKVIERSSGVAVDMAATKPALLAFDNPDYLLLLKQQEGEGRLTSPLTPPDCDLRGAR